MPNKYRIIVIKYAIHEVCREINNPLFSCFIIIIIIIIIEAFFSFWYHIRTILSSVQFKS